MDPIQVNLLKQTWFDKWHLFAAWLYLIIVAFDFLLAPIGNAIILAYYHYPEVQWQSITLQGGGLFHVSMMAIIGISTYGHSQQMLESIRNMPDYSNVGISSTTTTLSTGPSIISNTTENLNPQVDPSTILQSSHRGIPRG
jgi:predicted PurR-regulated permease PerM